jgi:hypothetical protein
MAQAITYNGFAFEYTTLRISHSPQLADDGRTVEGTRTTIRVAGFVISHQQTQADFVASCADMRRRLSSPRKVLLIQENGQTLFQSDPAGGPTAAEDAFGPIPGDLHIENISGGLAARYTWEITCFRKECASQASADFLSLTYQYSFVVDQQGYCTRTVSGKLLVKASATPADKYRLHVVPTIPKNYKRVSQNFAQSQDGRTLTFAISDAEVPYPLPEKITEGDASWTITSQLNAMLGASLSGHFQGPRSVTKADIMARILELFTNKYGANALVIGPGNPWTFRTMEFRESIYANRIDFSFSAERGAAMTAKLLSQLLGQLPPNRNAPHPIGPYGDAGNEMAPLVGTYDACIQTEQTETGQRVQNNGMTAPDPETPSEGMQDIDSLLSSSDNLASADQKQAPYIAYHERISYEFDNGIVVLQPKAIEGVGPFVQQTHLPALRVIQAGYCTRLAKDPNNSPKPPQPIMSLPGAVLLQASIEPMTPVSQSDGITRSYTVFWRYIIQSLATQPSLVDKDEIIWPTDPRLRDGLQAIPVAVDACLSITALRPAGT